MSRFEAESLLISLVGRTPNEGDVLTRDRERWRFDPSLAPTVELIGNGSLRPDFSFGAIQRIHLVQDTTVETPRNARHGRTYILIFTQGSPPRTVSFASEFKWVDGEVPLLSMESGAIDIISFVALEFAGELNFFGVAQRNFA